MKKKEVTEKDEPAIFEDAIIAGIFKAKKHRVVPRANERNRVYYAVYGDVKKSLKEIYDNAPVGALDVLSSIKETRNMIFTLLRRQ